MSDRLTILNKEQEEKVKQLSGALALLPTHIALNQLYPTGTPTKAVIRDMASQLAQPLIQQDIAKTEVRDFPGAEGYDVYSISISVLPKALLREIVSFINTLEEEIRQ